MRRKTKDQALRELLNRPAGLDYPKRQEHSMPAGLDRPKRATFTPTSDSGEAVVRKIRQAARAGDQEAAAAAYNAYTLGAPGKAQERMARLATLGVHWVDGTLQVKG